MLLLKWILAICTSALLAGISIMILMCIWQVFTEVVIEPIKAIGHHVPVSEDGLAK